MRAHCIKKIVRFLSRALQTVWPILSNQYIRLCKRFLRTCKNSHFRALRINLD